jgi:hypothetical protein
LHLTLPTSQFVRTALASEVHHHHKSSPSRGCVLVGPADSLGPGAVGVKAGVRLAGERDPRSLGATLQSSALLRDGRLLRLGWDPVSGRLQRLRDGADQEVAGVGGRRISSRLDMAALLQNGGAI